MSTDRAFFHLHISRVIQIVHEWDGFKTAMNIIRPICTHAAIAITISIIISIIAAVACRLRVRFKRCGHFALAHAIYDFHWPPSKSNNIQMGAAASG